MANGNLSAIAALTEKFQHILVYEGGKYIIAVAVMLAAIAVAEHKYKMDRKIQKRKATAADKKREFFASLRSLVVYTIVATPTFYLIHNGILPSKVIHGAGLLQSLAYFALLIVVHDAWFYWTHRTMHHRVLFKTLHKLHHKSVAPTPFAAYAFNVGEAVVQAVFVVAWIMVIPTPRASIVLFMTAVMVRDVINHAGTELFPRSAIDHWFWGKIITATHHDLHHSGGLGYNFGLYFTWWDRLMKTEHPSYRERFLEVTSRPARTVVSDLHSSQGETSTL